MTILWTTNMPICTIAEDLGLSTGGFGGWMEQAYNQLVGDASIRLIIVTSWNNKKIIKKTQGNIIFILT